MTNLMTTRYGDVHVTIQDGRTAYVRVSSGDRDDPTTAALELPRGALAYGRAHFKLGPDGWAVLEPASTYGLRRHPHADLTPTMREAAHGAIAEALAEHVDVEDLDHAQQRVNEAKAAELRAQAAALVTMADQLNRQATELEMDRDARYVYLRQAMRSGMDQRAEAVRTSRGELLFVDEPRGDAHPPFLAHDGRGLRRYRDEPAAWVERS